MRDHIAPWRSVYKIRLFTDTEVTFAVADGGHNVGIISEPGDTKRRFQLLNHRREDRYMDPDTWAVTAPHYQGSWWLAWEAWLVQVGSGGRVPPPPMGAPETGLVPLEPAPGR